MHRAIRWVAYALLAWLVVNALAYPFSYFIPKARASQAIGGTLLQNFEIVLLIGFVIVTIFADVFNIKHVNRQKNATLTTGSVAKQDLIETIIELDYPLFITALFLLIQIIIIYMVAF